MALICQDGSTILLFQSSADAKSVRLEQARPLDPDAKGQNSLVKSRSRHSDANMGTMELETLS